MISIFYCTRKPNREVNKQIHKSCTLNDVEIIEFVNNGTISLAEAYNIAIDGSKYDILVCIHDDIHLEKGWDKKIYDYFQHTDYGIVGVAGSTDLTANGVWWQERHRMLGRVMHPVYHNNQKTNRWHESQYCQQFPKTLLPVVCVDGLFIALDKNRIKSKFNTDFKGFHFYDIPFCVDNYLKGVKIGIATDIQIKHDSIGQPNQQWHINREQFVQQYDEKLPLNLKPNIIIDHSSVKLDKSPKLAIIIPSKNNFEFLSKCVNSLLTTKYSNLKIYIADTGSNENTIKNIDFLCNDVNTHNPNKIEVIYYDYYHFAKINNDMVKKHIDDDTEVLLFCNDDIEMLNDAISLMIQAYNKHEKHVGTIGCRLHYPDNSIQHGGIMLFNKQNQIGISHVGIRSYFNAPHDKKYDTIGNTGAFLMISKERFQQMDRFNENTEECFEDLLLNFDCIVHNYKNIYIGNAVCYHYESITRNKDIDKKQKEQNDLRHVVFPYIQKNINHFKKYIVNV